MPGVRGVPSHKLNENTCWNHPNRTRLVTTPQYFPIKNHKMCSDRVWIHTLGITTRHKKKYWISSVRHLTDSKEKKKGALGPRRLRDPFHVPSENKLYKAGRCSHPAVVIRQKDQSISCWRFFGSIISKLQVGCMVGLFNSDIAWTCAGIIPPKCQQLPEVCVCVCVHIFSLERLRSCCVSYNSILSKSTHTTKLDAGYPESPRQRQVDAIISQNVLSLPQALLQWVKFCKKICQPELMQRYTFI